MSGGSWVQSPVWPSFLFNSFMHFTYAKSHFVEYEPMDGPLVQTANKNSCLQISSKGVVFLSHKIDSKEQITHLYPVFHIPGLHV